VKLHRIKVRNLNSLVGDHELDLERDLGAPALFLIHGRTGAGKSTLLDAISLALFGKTPRLDGRRNVPDAEPGLVMSRGTAECRAEIEFSRLASDGPGRIYYRAIWQLRRARGSEHGRLQSPERSLERRVAQGNWELLASGRKQSSFDQARAEALHGFTSDDFFRSMLLAQGRFDEFLSATPEHRATILERLTDTARYRELGARAADAARAVNTRVSVARQRQQLHPDVSLQEREQARASAERAEATAEQLALRLSDCRRDLEYLSLRQSLLVRLTELEQRASELEARATELAPRQARLAEHRRCQAGFDALHELEVVRGQLRERDTNIAERRAAREALAADLLALRDRRMHLSEQNERANLLAQRLSIRAAALAATSERLASIQTRHERLAARRGTLLGLLAALSERGHQEGALLLEASQKLEELTGAVAPALLDTTTAARTIELRRALADARAKSEIVSQAARALLALESGEREHRERMARQSQLRDTEATLTARVAEARQMLTAIEEQLAGLEAELEATRLMEELLEHRGALRAGEPCPLCGALEHPFADRRQTDTGEPNLEPASGTLRQRRDRLRHDRLAAERAMRALEMELERVSTELRVEQAHAAEAREALENDSNAAARALERAGLAAVPSSEVHEACARAKLRVVELAEAEERLLELSARVLELTGSSERLALEQRLRTSELVEHEEQLAQATREQEELLAEIAGQREELEGLWREFALATSDGTDPDLLDTPLQTDRVGQAQRRVSQLQQLHTELSTAEKALEAEHTTQEGQLSLLEAQREELTRLIGELDARFCALLERLGLTSPLALAERRLEESTRLQIETAAEDLGRERASLAELLAERRRDWETCESRRPPSFDVAWLEMGARAVPILEGRVLEGEREHGVALAEIAAARAAASELERRSRLHAEAKLALGAAEQDGAVWLALDELVGTRDGESFQRFAQGLNLHLLLRQANRHLGKISGRYRLAGQGLSLQSNLELTVLDLWHLGEPRSIRSLSGGERFLVSLALALGLSDLRTPSLPIETLLLDEGFGSLDTETLDTALSALQSLEREGRQIGIISHVPELRERISAQVQILELGGGRSRIVVPRGT